MIGTLQATEAVKYLLGIGTSLAGRLLHMNALTMKFREIQLRKDPLCPLCGKKPTLITLTDTPQVCHSSNPTTHPVKPIIPSITVEELHQKLQQSSSLQLIDVREPFEIEIAHIPHAQLIPLGTLPSQLEKLNREQDIYLLCRSGGRSAEALLFLQKAGFSKLYNVEGGILAWAERIDPSVTKY